MTTEVLGNLPLPNLLMHMSLTATVIANEAQPNFTLCHRLEGSPERSKSYNITRLLHFISSEVLFRR